jgi:thiamine biosynthesis lipoprotein ApbE
MSLYIKSSELSQLNRRGSDTAVSVSDLSLLPKIDTSVHKVQSVSIIGQRGTLNVALFTTIFFLGVQKATDLMDPIP